MAVELLQAGGAWIDLRLEGLDELTRGCVEAERSLNRLQNPLRALQSLQRETGLGLLIRGGIYGVMAAGAVSAFAEMARASRQGASGVETLGRGIFRLVEMIPLLGHTARAFKELADEISGAAEKRELAPIIKDIEKINRELERQIELLRATKEESPYVKIRQEQERALETADEWEEKYKNALEMAPKLRKEITEKERLLVYHPTMIEYSEIEILEERLAGYEKIIKEAAIRRQNIELIATITTEKTKAEITEKDAEKERERESKIAERRRKLADDLAIFEADTEEERAQFTLRIRYEELEGELLAAGAQYEDLLRLDMAYLLASYDIHVDAEDKKNEKIKSEREKAAKEERNIELEILRLAYGEEVAQYTELQNRISDLRKKGMTEEEAAMAERLGLERIFGEEKRRTVGISFVGNETAWQAIARSLGVGERNATEDTQRKIEVNTKKAAEAIDIIAKRERTNAESVFSNN